MFSLLLALIATAQLSVPIWHEDKDPWTVVGDTVAYCGYWQHFFEFREKFGKLQLVEPDGNVIDLSGDPEGRWYCTVEFSTLPIVTGELDYWITLNFFFETSESLENSSIASDASETFCSAVKNTPAWGAVTFTNPDGDFVRHECEPQESL